MTTKMVEHFCGDCETRSEKEHAERALQAIDDGSECFLVHPAFEDYHTVLWLRAKMQAIIESAI